MVLSGYWPARHVALCRCPSGARLASAEVAVCLMSRRSSARAASRDPLPPQIAPNQTMEGTRMKGMMSVCALLVLSAPAVFAQQQNGAESPNQLSHQQQQLNMDNAAREASFGWYRQSTERTIHSYPALIKLRAELAEAWQSLGMSPAGAKIVADAFRPESTGPAEHTSLKGKSEEEVAKMLHDALEKKNYQLADQLLIKYEQARLALTPSTSPNGVR